MLLEELRNQRNGSVVFKEATFDHYFATAGQGNVVKKQECFIAIKEMLDHNKIGFRKSESVTLTAGEQKELGLKYGQNAIDTYMFNP